MSDDAVRLRREIHELAAAASATLAGRDEALRRESRKKAKYYRAAALALEALWRHLHNSHPSKQAEIEKDINNITAIMESE